MKFHLLKNIAIFKNDRMVAILYMRSIFLLCVFSFLKNFFPYPELRGEYGWSKLIYSTHFPVAKELVKDNVERVNYIKTSHEEFMKKYERPSIPVVLVGTQENWKAAYKWNLEVK